MASFWPTSRLSSVDLPAFGRPRNETNPDFMSFLIHDSRFMISVESKRTLQVGNLQVYMADANRRINGCHPVSVPSKEPSDVRGGTRHLPTHVCEARGRGLAHPRHGAARRRTSAVIIRRQAGVRVPDAFEVRVSRRHTRV